ncbi:MAG: hypothetical protein Q9P01_16695 [Anaerolineae bacterium]|nr:hypothetical protein [Anaerolineae bacterium]
MAAFSAKHREALLLFLKRSDVAPTNNALSKHFAIVLSTAKSRGVSRSDWGAELYANLISIT